MTLPSERKIRHEVVENAGDCPFCGWSPEVQHVSRRDSREYDEEYYGVNCHNCSAWYEDDSREWLKPVAPGEEQERVRV